MKLTKHLPILLALSLLLSCEEQMDDCPTGNFAVSVAAVVNTPCGSEEGSITLSTTAPASEAVTFSLNGGAFQEGNTFSGLAAGDYSITAQTAQGCMATVQAEVLLDTVSLEAVNVVNSGCGDATGQIEVAASLPGYTFSIDSVNFQESGTFSDLMPGTYGILARNEAGCQTSLEVQVLSGVSFENTIKNIIDTNCAISGCHAADSPNPTKLATLENVQALAERVQIRTSRRSMPPGDRSISQEEIDLIACWVEDGALDN